MKKPASQQPHHTPPRTTGDKRRRQSRAVNDATRCHSAIAVSGKTAALYKRTLSGKADTPHARAANDATRCRAVPAPSGCASTAICPSGNLWQNVASGLFVRNLRRITALFCMSAFAAGSAFAQSGATAGASASAFPVEGATDGQRINSEAWDSFRSGDGERMFGRWDQQGFKVSFDYMSEATLWGYRIARHTFSPSIEWVGPLFGGESYTAVTGYLPTDTTNYANQLWIYGGWRYHLTRHIDVDIGGTFVFADKRLAGPGLPVSDGWRARGTIYLGFIGRNILRPSVYTIYDFELDQTQFQLGLRPEIPVTDLGIPLENLFIEGNASIGYLQGNHWLGEPNQGKSWHNDYAYWEAGARLIYRFDGKLEGVCTHIGISYSGNNDGASYRTELGTINTGPRQQLSFNTGISYAF